MSTLERFLKYISIDSMSCEDSGTNPSSAGQLTMAELIVGELKEIGVPDVRRDDKGYVYGVIPASLGRENDKAIGFISHMDTAPAFSGKNIRPRIVQKYDGKDIILNSEKGIALKVSEFPKLSDYIGMDLIVTDGTTLLGADDKAGIAEIMSAAEEIISGKISHPRLCIAFTPDEEIGCGADYFDVENFGADYAYTVDGGEIGELEYENFNAASAKITVYGNCIHPGEGKNKMKNAALIAMEFNGMLPDKETPAHTEGYEGFFHLTGMNGNEENASLEYIIRDHSMEKFIERKNTIINIAKEVNEKYGENTVRVELKDSYYNMKEKILPHMEIIEKAGHAFEKNGITPKVVPIRGGTDGARLSYMGLPCPNLSTGGHNFHGKYEYIPVQSMEKMKNVLITLMSAE